MNTPRTSKNTILAKVSRFYIELIFLLSQEITHHHRYQTISLGKGFITENNLLKCLKEFNDVNLDDDELYHLTMMVNKNENGDLNYNDYVKVLRFRDVLA